MAVDAVHVVEQVVHGDHIRTRDALRLPEEMGHVQQIAAEALQEVVQFEVAGKRELVGLGRQHFEIRRQALGSRKLSRNSDKVVLVFVVQTRKRTNGVTRVGPHAELANTPDVDRDPHDTSVNRVSNLERSFANELLFRQLVWLVYSILRLTHPLTHRNWRHYALQSVVSS